MVKEFHYINSYQEGVDSAKMTLRRPIDANPEKGINGDDFAREIEFLEAMGVREVVIDINSIGGNIKEGFSIFSAIKDTKMFTTTRVVGIAASMAGMISQAGDKRIIKDYGILHTHGPQPASGKSADKGMLDIMRGSLKTILMSKAEISEEKADELLSKENVFTAVEAMELGFFDEVETTRGLKPSFDVSNSMEELFTMANQFIDDNNQNNNQMKELNTLLGLENEAKEEAVFEAIKSLNEKASKVEELENSNEELKGSVETLNNQVTELTNDLTSKDGEIETLKNELNDSLALNAAELIENSIKLGKIKEESKGAWINAAKNDYKGTKSLLEGINEVVNSPELPIEGSGDADESNNWDFQEWGQNNPEGLKEMKNSHPAKYEKLLNDYLKK